MIGLHYTNIEMFIPEYIKTKEKKYKFIKKNVKKFENILKNQINENDVLESRRKSFPRIMDLLKSKDGISLYNLKQKKPGSMYDGDYGLLKFFEEKLCCLLGLKLEEETDILIQCAPQSWMASNRTNRLVEGRKLIYIEGISLIPNNLVNKNELI